MNAATSGRATFTRESHRWSRPQPQNLVVTPFADLEVQPDGSLRATSSDPQLLVELPESVSGGLTIEMVLDSSAESIIEFFWSSDTGFRPEASVSRALVLGKNSLNISIPPRTPFRFLRIDPLACPGSIKLCTMTLTARREPVALAGWPRRVRRLMDYSVKIVRSLGNLLGYRRVIYGVEPLNQVSRLQTHRWLSTGRDPCFMLSGPLMTGPFLEISFELVVPRQGQAQLFFKTHGTWSEEKSVGFRLQAGRNVIRKMIYLPFITEALRFDPTFEEGEFELENLTISSGFGNVVRRVDEHRKLVTALLGHRLRKTIKSVFHPTHLSRRLSVIVPVYNGFDYLEPCLTSLLMNTTVDVELLVINDCSPDPRVGPYLDQFSLENPRIRVISNHENLGFVGTVNRGMADVSGDVILLNSDTEVPPRWAERLKSSAQRFPARVGTVTALSNNATICSYPQFQTDNDVSSTEESLFLDSILERHDAPPQEIPTAVGFCMYITRECLDQVGLFDAESFGKGYGEENDFCVRAQRQGFLSVAACNLFVYHKGKVSFASTSKASSVANLSVLLKKWPFYEELVAAFCRRDPLRILRHKFNDLVIKSRLVSGKPVVALILPGTLGGGTKVHVEDLVAHTSGTTTRVGIFLHDGYALVSLAGVASLRFDWNRSGGMSVIRLLLRLGVETIHIHHFLGILPEVRRVLNLRGVTKIATLHDYFTACPRYTLFSSKEIYCGGETAAAKCRACLIQPMVEDAVPYTDITRWRASFHELLGRFDRLIVPSRASRDIFSRYHPETTPPLIVPHGSRQKFTPIPWAPPSADEPLRVVCLGALGTAKGADLVEELARTIEIQGLPFHVTIVGYSKYHNHQSDAYSGALTITGPYKQSDLVELITRSRPHLILIPALWPETFSYTLTESWNLGLPVLGSHLGAVGERVAAVQGSLFLLDQLDLEGLLKKLELFRVNPDLLTQARNTILSTPRNELSLMNQQYDQLYRS